MIAGCEPDQSDATTGRPRRNINSPEIAGSNLGSGFSCWEDTKAHAKALWTPLAVTSMTPEQRDAHVIGICVLGGFGRGSSAALGFTGRVGPWRASKIPASSEKRRHLADRDTYRLNAGR